MRTAIVSDLHLGAASGEDLLRDAEIQASLFAEIAEADRLVLLGDVLELRDLPLHDAVQAARPFFVELGRAREDRETIIVPGNHDHRLAEALLDSLALSGERLGLEHRFQPTGEPATQLDRWLGDAPLGLAYPGLWLREDVYATHGHYMDCHLAVPRAECVAAAALMRARGGLGGSLSAEDYERTLRPIYGLAFGLAQSGAQSLSRGASRPSERAWKLIAGNEQRPSRTRRATRAAVAAAIPGAVWALNKGLGAEFDPDFSAASITHSGIAAAREMSRRLDLKAAHVITGHTHRAGPGEEEETRWEIPGGGLLHNTGSWVFADAFHHPGRPPGPYWPGTVTWLDGEGAPRRVRVLNEHPHAELTGAVRRNRSVPA